MQKIFIWIVVITLLASAIIPSVLDLTGGL